MVCLELDDFISVLGIGESEQGWLRVDRKRGKWYEVNGGKDRQPQKYPKGIDVLLEALGSPFSGEIDEPTMELQT
jgi:hypothetical protein